MAPQRSATRPRGTSSDEEWEVLSSTGSTAGSTSGISLGGNAAGFGLAAYVCQLHGLVPCLEVTGSLAGASDEELESAAASVLQGIQARIGTLEREAHNSQTQSRELRRVVARLAVENAQLREQAQAQQLNGLAKRQVQRVEARRAQVLMKEQLRTARKSAPAKNLKDVRVTQRRQRPSARRI